MPWGAKVVWLIERSHSETQRCYHFMHDSHTSILNSKSTRTPTYSTRILHTPIVYRTRDLSVLVFLKLKQHVQMRSLLECFPNARAVGGCWECCLQRCSPLPCRVNWLLMIAVLLMILLWTPCRHWPIYVLWKYICEFWLLQFSRIKKAVDYNDIGYIE